MSNWTSSNGTVHGIIEFGTTTHGVSWARIDEWTSTVKQMGHTRQALQELRTVADKITANGIGFPGSISYPNWLAMLHAKLIDMAIDDDGNELT